MKMSREALINVGLLVLFGFLSAFLIHFSWQELPADVEIGRIASHDIRADADYEIIDEEETEKLKSQAVQSVLPVFDWDDSRGPAKIVENLAVLEPWKGKGILIRRANAPQEAPLVFRDLSGIISLEEVRSRVHRPDLREKIQPTLFFNEEETTVRQERAAAESTPVVIKVRQGESIIRAGDDFEAWHLKVIRGILKQKAKSQRWTRLGGAFAFILLFVGVLYGLSRPAVGRLKLMRRDLIFNGVLLLVVLLIGRLFLFFADGIRNFLPFDLPLSAFYAAIPVGAGAMLVRLVLPVEVASLFALVSAVMSGIFENSLPFTLFYLVQGIAGVAFVGQARGRTDLLKAGLWTGLVNIGVLAAVELLDTTSVGGILSAGDLMGRLLFAGIGGVLCAVAVIVLMPIFESVFNYLTPIKLLEFGSLNHPILREMIVRAPGTYHHSHMVGTLAEAACEAIGADALFARVASYFHDVGKLKKATYFIENQAEGEDRHAALSPSMSALIISSHVKDGMDLARDHKLPQRIIDIIPQHQGTKLISYFYSKAKEKEDLSLHAIDEKDYRYPGPKPQTREAGVILLADTVEATTRALKDRSPSRIEEVVRNMINKNFIDGQLDECELTLKDLHTIAKSFVRILMGIYHQRVEYPEEPEKSFPRPVESHDDKYSESKPITKNSFREAADVPHKDLPRIGSRH